MTHFPDRKYETAGAYLMAYAGAVHAALTTVDPAQLQKAADALEAALTRKAQVFICGNGGSAAIAGHFTCDHLKGVATGTDVKPKVISLSSNIELITAVANDISYDDVFSFQLSHLAMAGDVLVTVSSSGNSPNIVKAVDLAKTNGVTVIAMTGFSGGESRKRADVSLHVDAENYGIVEDAHQSLMHILAHYLRQKRLLDPASIGKIKF